MTAATKAQRRRQLLAARREVPESLHRNEARQLCAHLPAVVGGARTVCAYLPVGSEPGSAQLLDELLRLCDEVLLPVTAEGDDRPLSWGRYVPGTLVAARFGLREPPAPWLPPEAISRADLVLVPAVAVDRSGVRLGRGGGFYDRSLVLCSPGTPLVAVVRDDEVVAALPHDQHDIVMTHALTPGTGLIRLGECHPADGGSST